MTDEGTIYLNTREAAARLGLSTRTLDRYRVSGDGPVFLRFGGRVTGAAHGDLSSEKVYVRFRTMTCAGPRPGTVIETPVAGFVAGAGKTGVRGPVVSREGALVEKAFLAGMVSGVGQGVSQAFQPAI